MNNPQELKYSATHEWIRREDDSVVIGITDHAQDELGDIVYIELPEVGRILAKEDIFGTVESVKAVSDLYSPVSGEVIEANSPLTDKTETLNTDAFGEGWLIKVKMNTPTEFDELLSADDYDKQISEQE